MKRRFSHLSEPRLKWSTSYSERLGTRYFLAGTLFGILLTLAGQFLLHFIL